MGIGATTLALNVATGTEHLSSAVATQVFRFRDNSAGIVSPTTAICIALLSIPASCEIRPSLAKAMAALVSALTGVVVLGYAYDIGSFAAIPLFHAMSPSSASCLLLLAVSLLCVDGERGWPGVICAPGAVGRGTRWQFAYTISLPFIGWLILAATRTNHIPAPVAIAILVVLTIIPLLYFILQGGYVARSLELRTLDLKNSELRYRQLAETTNDVITISDLGTNISYASPACRTVFGYEPDAFVGQNLMTHVHSNDQAGFRNEILTLQLGGIERTLVTYRLRHGDTRWIWIETTLRLVNLGNVDAPASLLCSHRDISERHAHAEYLQETNVVLNRSAEALRRALDEAERATCAKTRFLAGMSHELRTPLNCILGYAQLLRIEGGLKTGQLARIEAMMMAGTHLLEVIRSVLDLSEIETGRVVLHLGTIDIYSLAASCVDLIRPQAGMKSLPVTLVTELGLTRTFVADSTRLRQVLVNLLGNAVKFTESGNIELRLRRLAGEFRPKNACPYFANSKDWRTTRHAKRKVPVLAWLFRQTWFL
jgi:PAS domain S-box-containing protein